MSSHQICLHHSFFSPVLNSLPLLSLFLFTSFCPLLEHEIKTLSNYLVTMNWFDCTEHSQLVTAIVIMLSLFYTSHESLQKKKTPGPVVHKRTIPTDRPTVVGEI
jgi:hypothetical protein